MNHRQDALSAAARAVLALREEVRSKPGRQVGTVGYMRVEPGATNVIAGKVDFSIDLRDLDGKKLDQIWDGVEKRFAEIAKDENVTLECSLRSKLPSAMADANLQTAIRSAATSAGLATTDLPSGACHDAQELASITKMGMIFIPSQGGISHSPGELSAWEDISNGAEVLYRTVLLLDAASSKPSQ
jgi:N-carbamoyl-L-amino-acid hydrolase